MKKHFKKFLSQTLAILFAASSISFFATAESVDSGLSDSGEEDLFEVSQTGWGEYIRNAGTLDKTESFSVDTANKLNIQASEEGMVLLKNENDALPLTSEDTVAFFGSSQLWNGKYARFGYRIGGAGSGAVYASPKTSPIAEFRKKANDGRFKIYDDISELYETYYLPNAALYPSNVGNYYNDGEYALAEHNDIYFPDDDSIAAAKAAGVNKVVYIFSRLEGEAGTEEAFLPSNGEFEVTGDPDDRPIPGQYYLSENEENHLRKLRENFENVIVVANTGDLIDTTWAKYGIDYDGNGKYTQVADSVLFSWYGGLRAAEALANVLTGDANPSGKLTETAAKSIDDYPSTEGFFESAYTNYYEDIFVGYRYFETFDPNYEKVNYEFGFGLSYTTFDISEIKYEQKDEFITVSAKVTNTGDVCGKEIVQVYFSAPQMGVGEAKLSKPAKELAGYAKTGEISPGNSETVYITFPIKDMASYDDVGATSAKSAYVLEKGDYLIYLGNFVKNVVKAGVYTVDEFTVTEQLTAQATPYKLEKRLLADGNYEMLETGEIPQEEYKPYYGLPIYGNIKIEGESFDSTLSVGSPGSESFTSGTLIEKPIYLDENDSAGDFDYKTASKKSYVGSQLCQMHVSVKQAVYAINVGESGYYNIHIRGSGTKTNDFLRILVNGTDSGLSFNFPNVRGVGEHFAHADVYYHSSKQIYLSEGKNLISLENKNIDFINLDFIEFVKVEDYGASKDETAKITVEGESFDVNESVGVKSEDNKYTPELAENIVWSLENVVDYSASTWVSYPGSCVSGIDAGDKIVYNVSVPEDGNYELSMIACRPTSVVTDFFDVRIGDKLYEYNLTFPQTGGREIYFKYINWNFGGKVVLPLSKGENRITFEITQGGPLIDSFTLEKVVVPITVEAENYDENLSSGVFKKENNGGASALATKLVMKNDFTVDYENTVWEKYDSSALGVCVSGIKAGAQLVYDIEVPEDGNYLLGMRACRPTNCHINFMDIEANGEKTAYAVNFPQTGADETKYFQYIDYYFENQIVLNLKKGSNRIKLLAKTTMPLIDKIFLAKTTLLTSNDIIVEGESLLETSVGSGYEALSTSSGKYSPLPILSGNAVDVQNTVWYALKMDGACNLSKVGNNTGNTAIYKFTAKADGTYGLIIRGAKSNNSTDRGFISMDVNGTTYEYENTVFPKTGDSGVYFNFIDVDYSDVVKIPLVCGENTVTFKNVKEFPNVDFFKFVYIENSENDNTSSYVKDGDEPKTYGKVITFADVKAGINTTEELLSQMAIEELASFAVLSEEPNYSAQRSGVGGNKDVQTKFGVPVATTLDGPVGPTTRQNEIGFASGITIACTWNIDIAANFGIIVGKAAQEHGNTNFWLAPGMNIQRNPLGGRNFEYFSEDPLITGLCAAAITHNVQQYGVSVAPKHFAVNNKETNRSGNDSRVSERALREIYLRGFELLVKDSSPIAIMTGYNLVNGYECAEHNDLLIEIARKEWGFDGMFMTDWGLTPNLYKMVKNGCNTNMGNYQNMWDSNVLVKQYIAENLTRKELTQNAKYIVNALLAIDINDNNSKSQKYSHTLSATQITDIEAEQFSSAHTTVQIESRSGASSEKNIGSFDFKDDNGNFLSYAEFDINVPKNTTYDLAIAISSYSSKCLLDFRLDGVLLENIGFASDISTATNDWNAFSKFNIGQIALTEGKHIIRVSPRYGSGSFNFDKLIFTPEISDNVLLSFELEREFSADMSEKYSAREYGNETYGSGAVLTITNNNDKIIVLNESDAIFEKSENGNAVISFKVTLEKGNYTATLEKNGYVKKTTNFLLTDNNMEFSAKTKLIGGDIKESYSELDGDGIVDIDDFIRIIHAFFSEASETLKNVTDINEDGVTNVADICIVKNNFGAYEK